MRVQLRAVFVFAALVCVALGATVGRRGFQFGNAASVNFRMRDSDATSDRTGCCRCNAKADKALGESVSYRVTSDRIESFITKLLKEDFSALSSETQIFQSTEFRNTLYRLKNEVLEQHNGKNGNKIKGSKVLKESITSSSGNPLQSLVVNANSATFQASQALNSQGEADGGTGGTATDESTWLVQCKQKQSCGWSSVGYQTKPADSLVKTCEEEANGLQLNGTYTTTCMKVEDGCVSGYSKYVMEEKDCSELQHTPVDRITFESLFCECANRVHPWMCGKSVAQAEYDKSPGDPIQKIIHKGKIIYVEPVPFFRILKHSFVDMQSWTSWTENQQYRVSCAVARARTLNGVPGRKYMTTIADKFNLDTTG